MDELDILLFVILAPVISTSLKSRPQELLPYVPHLGGCIERPGLSIINKVPAARQVNQGRLRLRVLLETRNDGIGESGIERRRCVENNVMFLAQGLDRLCIVESAVNNAIYLHFGLEPVIGLIVAVEDRQRPVWMGLLQLLGQRRL